MKNLKRSLFSFLILLGPVSVGAAEPNHLHITVDFDVTTRKVSRVLSDSDYYTSAGFVFTGKINFPKDVSLYADAKLACKQSVDYKRISLLTQYDVVKHSGSTAGTVLRHQWRDQFLQDCRQQALLALSNPKKYLLQLTVWEWNPNEPPTVLYCDGDSVEVTNLMNINECSVARR